MVEGGGVGERVAVDDEEVGVVAVGQPALAVAEPAHFAPTEVADSSGWSGGNSAAPPTGRLRDTDRLHVAATLSAGAENSSSIGERHFVDAPVTRAGGYTYDWLERLAGLNVTSADRIIEELQHLVVGDVIPVDNDGTGLRVMLINPPHVLATRNDEGTWSWTWTLEPLLDQTRLISRTRMAFTSLANRLSTQVLMVPASLVMERKMLLGLRERAERHARQAERGVPA